VKGAEPNRREPITPVLLLKIRRLLDWTKLDDVAFCAVSLVGFYGLLRISNIIPYSNPEFDPGKNLSRGMFQRKDWGFLLKLGWAKNIQCRERVLMVTLPELVGHPLCPVRAVELVFSMTEGAQESGPAIVRGSPGKQVPVLYSWYIRKLQDLVARCGMEAMQFGTHSLRRGGASWWLRCGLSSDVIRVLGDWHSDAYQAYLEIPLEDKVSYCRAFASSILLMGD
jgi:hypothetical protein